MPSIADLFITVSSDVSGALNGLSQVDQQVNGTAQSMQSAVPAGLALAGAATAVGGAFLASIDQATSFEHAMSAVQSVLSPDEVNTYGGALSQLALTLGRDTVFSANQAAGAIEELVKAGVPVETVMNGGAAAALSLASATGISVAQAATFAGVALNTFHENADQLAGTVDTLARVANASAADVGDLQFAFASVGPVAANLGLSFDDVATALGIFANNGLRGSDAGTSLRTMLLNLEPATRAQVGQMEALGLFSIDTGAAITSLGQALQQSGAAGMAALNSATRDGNVTMDELFNALQRVNPALLDGATSSTQYARQLGLTSNAFFDANGNARSMTDIFGILQQATANLTAEQRTNALQIIFGTDAVRGASIAAREGADGFNALTTTMAAAPDAAQAAATRLNNLSGDLTNLSGSFETVQITIGQLFLPALRDIVQIANSVLAAFLTLDPGMQTLIVAAIGIAGALAAVTAAFILIGPVVASTAAGFVIIGAAAAPVLIALAGMAAVGAALYQAWQTDFGGIREVAVEAFAAIQPGLANIQQFASVVADALAPAFRNASDTMGPFVQQLSQQLGPVLQQIPPAIRAIGDAFNTMSAIIQQAITIFEQFATAVGLEDRLNAIGAAAGAFIQTLLQIDAAILNFVDTITQAINGQLPDIMGALGDLFGPIVDQAWQLAPRLGDAFANWLNFIGSALSDILPTIIAGAGDIFGDIINAAWEIAPRIGDAFGNFLGYIGDALSGIPAMIEGLGDLFGPFVNAVWAIGGPVGDAIVNVLGFIGEQFSSIPTMLTGFGDIFGPIIQAAEALVGRIADAIGPIRDLLANTFGSFWGFLTGSITLPTAPTGGGTGGGTTTPPITGTSGPIVSVGTLIISSQQEANDFLNLVAQAVLASANRVTPPATGGNPALA